MNTVIQNPLYIPDETESKYYNASYVKVTDMYYDMTMSIQMMISKLGMNIEYSI